MARGCVRWMAEAGSEATAATVALCVRSVCVQYARGLLAEAPRVKQAEFLSRWRQAVPSAMTVCMEMLRGEVRDREREVGWEGSRVWLGFGFRSHVDWLRSDSHTRRDERCGPRHFTSPPGRIDPP